MAADANQSVERSAKILEIFTAGSIAPELRVGEVAKAAGLGLSTTSRLLATLEKVGFVKRDPVTQLYSLGHNLITLGALSLNQEPIFRAARQVAQNLAAKVGFGVNVAVRDGDSIFYLCNFEGPHAPRSFTLSGQRNPLAATGLGKCLLSTLSESERRRLLRDLPRYTSRTITDHDALDAELALIGERGYATEVEELALGRACVAVPIRDLSGSVVAGMSMSGALTVIDLANREAELAALLIEAADAVSVQLGYSPRQFEGIA